MNTLNDLARSAWATMYVQVNSRDFWHVFAMVALAIVSMTAATEAFAMPWEKPICQVAISLSGPTAKAVAVIAVVVCGLMLAFGELNGIFKTFLGLLMGVAMALMAVQWVGFIGGDENSSGGFCQGH